MRAFLGIALSNEVRAFLERVQEQLAASRADVKWVEPAHLHVTLKFLGEISETQRQMLEALLDRVAAGQAPFMAGLGDLGAFPSFDAPRVIWTGLTEGREQVIHIAERIEQDGSAIPLRREERPYTPHITLGRVRSSRWLQALSQCLRASLGTTPSPWRVNAVTLYQSTLDASGPTYTVLADVALTGPAPGTP